MLGTFDEWGDLNPEDPAFETKVKERVDEQQSLAAKRLFSLVQNNGFVVVWNLMPYPPKVKAKIFSVVFEKFIEEELFENCSQLRDEMSKFQKKYPQFEEDFKSVFPDSIT